VAQELATETPRLRTAVVRESSATSALSAAFGISRPRLGWLGRLYSENLGRDGQVACGERKVRILPVAAIPAIEHPHTATLACPHAAGQIN
jgi:hypothetical protein